MNQNFPRNIPWLSLGLLVLLLALTPYAISFAPHGPYFLGQQLHEPDSPASLYSRRVILIIFGLVATVVCFGEFCVTLLRYGANAVAIAPSLATFFVCAVIGWRSYPYWIMGVYQVDLGTFPMRDQDPKSMIPMVWIGELWRIPVLLLTLASNIIVPALAALTIVLLFRRQLLAAGITVASTSLGVLFMLAFSVNYLVWLMD